ncbi:MAG: fructokinase [Epulopiscium sp.]|jgi:fructokinase|nr:fructokinase [Candidatus Epulonipiscium sp.]
MYDVVALGELLIDFTPAGLSSNQCFLFEQNPGGAPANVLSVLSKFNKATGFIGKLGNDQFGHFLKGVLDDINVSTEGIVFDDEVRTTLAFVHLDENGDRKFSFYRNPGADMMLKEEEINLEMIKNSKVFHFGSLSMTHEPARSATLKALKYAKEKDLLVSYDPNYRPLLWKSIEEAKQQIKEGLRYADILKVSEEELELITGIDDMKKATEFLYKGYDIPFITVTLGDKGSYFRKADDEGYVSPYKVKAIDTTGAGDGFLGALLYQILESGKVIKELEISELENMLRFSNATGALITMKRGAISAIPTLEEVYDFIKTQGNH